ncbi:hypothetical protein A6302_04556 [Methylobrevis pamukkalensis]|uniref:Uncharacterized protein n=1 Tax=Methylobrevis pamukkalensis TaxID=1439726 RepID=A0A1E3GPL4_9HYPH|nr:hypothetical protein A6302_04556 [Methylobrevis pamukkalensis]
MGTDAAGLATQLAAALPLMLTPIQNPAFQAQLASAASAFLKDPKSITLTAAPAKPMTFMELFATAQSAPQTLPDALGVTVTANE